MLPIASTERDDDDDDADGRMMVPMAVDKPGADEQPMVRAATMLNGTLGPGMLVLPLAFARTGLVCGVCLLLGVWTLSFLALLLLLEACSAQHGAPVSELAQAYGPVMGLLTDWAMLLFFYGNCVSYLILVGGTFTLLFFTDGAPFQLSPHWPLAWPLSEQGGDALLVVFTIGVILPLS